MNAARFTILIIAVLAFFCQVSPGQDVELAPTLAGPLDGSEEAAIDENVRFAPQPRPDIPPAQHPPAATTQNVDTNKPVHEWQRLSDDWHGVRPRLDDAGISFNANLTMDATANLRGGANTEGQAFRRLLNANITLDSEKLLKFKGGTLFANFQHQAGDNGAEKLSGDFQVISNIDADGRNQLSELWFEQKLVDDKVRLKVGKIDANTEFSALEFSGEFINGAFGGSTAILLPTYPDPAVGLCAFYQPTEMFSIGGGIFDGAYAQGFHSGENGIQTVFNSPSEWFLITEANIRWSTPGKKLPGRFGLGLWRHTGQLAALDGQIADGTGGVYALFEHALTRKNPENADDAAGWSMFLQFSLADDAVLVADRHLRSGLVLNGPFEARPDDATGLACTCSWFSQDAGTDDDFELTIETFYKAQLLPFLSLKPDLQYIVNPGGIRLQDDAVVLSLRLSIDF